MSASPAVTGSPFADVNVRLRELQNRMDTIFTDTFRNVGSWFHESPMASSIDLREESNDYVARVYVPNGEDTSKVNASVENGALHVTAESHQTVNGATEAEKYEQTVSLPKPVQADKINIDRKQNLVVITVPKTSPSEPAPPASSAVAAASPASSASPGEWDQTMFNQLARMQADMDATIHNLFQTDLNDGASISQLGSAMNLDDQKDKYVVHFYLPDRNLSDVNVKFENGQLQLTAKEQKNSQATNSNASSMAMYEEMLTLPGPVKQDQMKVDRKNGSIVVTVPKA
jgi:HSP20 family molecular chaperone IbpA